MKNKFIIFIAQFISNIISVLYVKFIAKDMLYPTLVVDFMLCIMNFTIIKKIIEDKNDKFLWLYYTLGSVIGTLVSMKLFNMFLYK